VPKNVPKNVPMNMTEKEPDPPMDFVPILATAISTSTPLVFASIGETFSERAGVINLSAEGTIMLSAMTGFALARTTGSLMAGFVGAALTGAAVALIVAFGSITLAKSQVAIGFVLALLCADLSSVLGNPFVRVPGLTVPDLPIPWLRDIPFFGPLFFRSDALVYASYLLVIGSTAYFYGTRAGLLLRAIGEKPTSAYVRGANVARLRYAYTLVGGALMGIGGAAFSLDFKAGWSHRHTAGYGWIALAIVIFGGWHPAKVAAGAYVFGILQSVATVAQSAIPEVPTQVFGVAPFALMIGVLVLTSRRRDASQLVGTGSASE